MTAHLAVRSRARRRRTGPGNTVRDPESDARASADRACRRGARNRLSSVGRLDRVRLIQGDGAHLPVLTGVVDAVFMSFVLDLFDTPEIPQVLAECRRVLRSGGRLGVVSLFLSERPGFMTMLYEGGHRLLARLLDCRPIPAPRMLEKGGFSDLAVQVTSVCGLPVVAVIGTTP